MGNLLVFWKQVHVKRIYTTKIERILGFTTFQPKDNGSFLGESVYEQGMPFKPDPKCPINNPF